MEGKGKGISTEQSKEEKKIDLDKEMERKRQIHSILRLRQRHLPGIEKGDPTKPFSYETIEQVFSLGDMSEFLKVPKKEL